MEKMYQPFGALASAALATIWVASLGAQEPAPVPAVTVKQIMEKTITPATNTLWNVPEAPSDEEWAALEEAAVTLLVAVNAVSIGGAGSADKVWAAQPAWRETNGQLLEASRGALAAVAARDVAALQALSDALYTPCESCHQQFNPGVAGQQ